MALSARKPFSCGVPSGSSSSTAVLTTQACPESCIRKTLRPWLTRSSSAAVRCRPRARWSYPATSTQAPDGAWLPGRRVHDGEDVLAPLARGDARRTGLQPGPGQVDMAVDEAGQHGGAAQVDDLAGGQRGHGLVHTDDPPPPDAQVVGDGVPGVHREDARVGQSRTEHGQSVRRRSWGLGRRGTSRSRTAVRPRRRDLTAGRPPECTAGTRAGTIGPPNRT